MTLVGICDESGTRDRIRVTVNGVAIYVGTAWFRGWDGEGNGEFGGFDEETNNRYEEIKRGSLVDLAEWAAEGVRGEITVVLGGAEQAAPTDPAELARQLRPWKATTSEQVQKLVKRMEGAVQYRHLLDQLQNPRWMEPLRERGFFAKPPEPILDYTRGTIGSPPWPESGYLARAALLAEQVNRQFWLPDREFYAMGVDSRKNPIASKAADPNPNDRAGHTHAA